jgi:signal transduction histidine kinase/CheY-like chemotaxis protein
MVLAIFEDSQNDIWVGTERGLNRLDIKNLKFTRFYADLRKPDGLSSDMPWSFFEDAQGTLWIGTSGGGLNLWRLRDRLESRLSIKHFSRQISLPSSSIYGIEGDEQGWVWVSHNKGLTRIQPRTLEAKHYGVRDGLQDTEFTLGASYRGSDGRIYFGGTKGFNTTNPESLTVNRTPPKVSISQIRVMNERREFEQPYRRLSQVDLVYEDRMFAIDFYAADYANPELITYAYKLEGLDDDWVISDLGTASFTTLPPGKYTLRLAAASPDGTWNWDGRSLSIHVAPPWWRSPFAYASYLALLGAALISIYLQQQRKTRESLKRQRELEQRVHERTIDLNEARKVAEEATKAKSEFLATMSHEIRTTMHGIIGMTDLLMHTNLTEQQTQFATAARNSGEALLSLINEILDFSKVEASKVELEEIEFDLNDVIDDVCYLQSEPASKKGLKLNNICDPNVPPNLVGDPTKIRQILMNFLSNSIKFTQHGNINVMSKAYIDGDQTRIEILVQDDGIGMDEKTLKKVFEPFTQADASTTREYGGTGLGLSISRNYIDLMNGSIDVSSMPGRGTTITVSIPFDSPKAISSKNMISGHEVVVVTDDQATFSMVSSQLARLGIECSYVNIKDNNPSIIPTSNLIIILDGESFIGDHTAWEHEKYKNTAKKILLVPINIDLSNVYLNDWVKLTKPVTRIGLQNAMSNFGNLDQNESRHNTQSSHSKATKKNVLVAEDLVTNQRIIEEMINLLGHQVDIASNGKEAVRKYAIGHYDTIFMDCQMPIMDGYEATREIRKLERQNGAKNTRIVALTAGTSREDHEQCYSAGMDSILTKPFTLDEIELHLGRVDFDSVQATSGARASESDEKQDIPDNEPTTSEADLSEILNLPAIKNIQEVEKQTGKSILNSIFAGFTEQMDLKIVELEQNIASSDDLSIYKSSHAIKSMSANIGAKKIAEISARIEEKGKQGQRPGLAEDIELLKLSYSEFKEIFQAEFTQEERAS